MFINFVDYFLYSYISILNCFSILFDRCFVNIDVFSVMFDCFSINRNLALNIFNAFFVSICFLSININLFFHFVYISAYIL